MAVVNIAFDLKPEIQAGLISGDYRLFGGVVRNRGGEIVCFLREALKVTEASELAASNAASSVNVTSNMSTSTSFSKSPATITSSTTPSLFGSIGQFVTAHPVATGITVVTVSAGIIAYLINKRQRKKIVKEEQTKAYVAIKRFKESLDKYSNALRIGKLNQSIVMELMSAIDDIRGIMSNGIVKIELPAELIDGILEVLCLFTKEFASANHYDYEEPARPGNNDACSNLIYLKDYLEIQKEIYSAA